MGEKKRLKHHLDALSSFLELFGAPQEKIKIIHVAGTNGKGSTCAMLERVLRCEGYKTGMFTSPHITRYNERFQINGKAVTNAELARLFTLVADAQKTFFADPDETFSFFEILTIMSFIFFHEARVDFLLLETGLGGRLDSTNIIKNPLVSVITSVSFDHAAILGRNISSIAFEKAGIIKKNRPAVLYLNSKDVYNVVEKKAQEQNSKLYFVGSGGVSVKIVSRSVEQTCFSAYSPLFSYENIALSLFGDFQLDNAIGVLTVIETLCRESGVVISAAAVKKGLRAVRHPARMEIVSKDPVCIIDGAHNEDGAKAFTGALEYFSGGRLILIVGILADKPINDIVANLPQTAACLIATKPGAACGYDGEDIAEAFLNIGFGGKIIIENNPQKAAETAFKTVEKNDVIAAAGSLYLCGALRGYIKRYKAFPFDISNLTSPKRR